MIALACLATSANAACPTPVRRAEIVEILTGKLNETQRSFGLSGSGTVIETFASGAGTWTILETRTDGKTCILAAGQRWRDAAPAKPGDQI